ncbi:MAG: 4Fe-4S dicluster domain-containing protein [Planctomycetota bacterium]|nr:MAG: 4Fe-4S dicluster domain-containing protein [Planctomycetota bacterium]
MRKPKLREVVEAVKALIVGPVTTKFPFEPCQPPENFRGKPTFYQEDCIGCKACAEVCTTQCIDVYDDVTADPPNRKLVLRYDKCIFCGHCELNCTTQKGIRLGGGEYDLACFDRSTCVETVDNELVVCETCGAIVGARKHLLFVADRLGAKRYANPTLILTSEGDLGLTEAEGGRSEDKPLTREDLMRVTCPKCRRTLVLQELWGD